jgi:hypothetical protein
MTHDSTVNGIQVREGSDYAIVYVRVLWVCVCISSPSGTQEECQHELAWVHFVSTLHYGRVDVSVFALEATPYIAFFSLLVTCPFFLLCTHRTLQASSAYSRRRHQRSRSDFEIAIPIDGAGGQCADKHVCQHVP